MMGCLCCGRHLDFSTAQIAQTYKGLWRIERISQIDRQGRREAKGNKAPWPKLMRDLGHVQAVHLPLDIDEEGSNC